MTRDRQLLLGAFFLIVFLVLGAYTLLFSEFSLFKEQHVLTAFFPDANGLRRGDSVLVAGLRDGKVRELTYDPSADLDKRITVVIVLDKQVELRDGSDVFIEDSTVLGGKHVYIDPGPPDGAPRDMSKPIVGRVKEGALGALGKLVDDNGTRVTQILEDASVVIADLKAGKGMAGMLLQDEAKAQELRESLASIKTTFANVESLTADVKAGKGVLGRLVTDEDLAQQLETIGENLSKITTDFTALSADLKEGKGTLGRLMQDEQLGDEVARAVETIRTISERINAGEGTLWRLIEDDTLAKRLEAFTENMEKGTLGQLVNNDELYVKFSAIIDDLAFSAAAIRGAEGTLGKLVMDRELYDEVAKALRILTRTLEEYREAAPITTFSSVLFGAF